MCDFLIEGLLLLLLTAMPLVSGAVQPWSIALFEASAALMFLFWIFKTTTGNRYRSAPHPFILPVLLFIVYIAGQLLFSATAYSYATKTELLKVISYALIFIVVLNTVKTKRQFDRIIFVIITMGFTMSVFFLTRYFGGKTPSGFINDDHFAGYLGMVIPLALGSIFVSSNFLILFCMAVMSAALFFTMSRGGMLAFIGSLIAIVMFTLTRKSLRKRGGILLCAVILILSVLVWLGVTPIIERLSSISVEIMPRYFNNRFYIWKGALGIIKDNFLFGTGLGTFNHVFPGYQPLKIIHKHYTYAHNDFLELLSETGMLGFSVFLTGLLIFSFYVLNRFRSRHDPYVVRMSLGFFGSLTGIFIHSFTDFNLHIPANAVLLTVLIPLFINVLNHQKGKTEVGDGPSVSQEARAGINPVLRWFFFLVLLFFIATCIMPAVADHHYRNKNYKKAIQFEPGNALYHYVLAEALTKERRHSEAAKEYETAALLNPTNSKYRQSLAWAYGRLAGFNRANRGEKWRYMTQANSEFRKALLLEPNNPYRYRAYALWLFNDPDGKNSELALRQYRHAVELMPQMAAEALRAYRAHQKDYRKLPDILPGTPESDYVFFEFLAAEKDLAFAIRFSEENLRTYAKNGKIAFAIADKSFYDTTYDWEFSKEHHRKALELEPDNAFFRYWYGVHLAYKRKFNEAQEQFDLAEKIDGGYSKQIREFQSKYK